MNMNNLETGDKGNKAEGQESSSVAEARVAEFATEAREVIPEDPQKKAAEIEAVRAQIATMGKRNNNPREEINNPKSIEESANFEGNWSEVLFDRLNNPVIREQLVGLFYKEQLAKQEYFHTEPFTLDFIRADGDKVYKDSKGKQALENEINSFVSKSKEEIEEMLDERIAEASLVTNIEFSDRSPTEEKIGLFWRNPYTGKLLTPKQMSMTESHEKGHTVRPFFGQFFRDYFAPGFDKSKVNFTKVDLEALLNNSESLEGRLPDPDDTESKTPEQIRENQMEYLFSGNEIAERMSQLKNYFGMRGSDQFTHDYLEYARKHYLEDVGVDNGITHFFQSITPETEENFLHLINNSGI